MRAAFTTSLLISFVPGKIEIYQVNVNLASQKQKDDKRTLAKSICHFSQNMKYLCASMFQGTVQGT